MGSKSGKRKIKILRNETVSMKGTKKYIHSVNTFIIISKEMSMRDHDGVSWKRRIRTNFLSVSELWGIT